MSRLLFNAMEKVSNDGVITVEESKTMHTELDLVEGMQFDRGYISFDDTGRILISERLDDNNRMYMNITAKMKIDITEENIKYIKYHRKNVFIEK